MGFRHFIFDLDGTLLDTELAGAKPESCIYIGDMPTDIACANSAGLVSGLVTWNGSGMVCPEAAMVFERPEEVVRCADEF